VGKDPAMPLYVNDWLSSRRVQTMTQLQELAYFRLLCFCWTSGDASLPDDDNQLAVLSRMGEEWFKGSSTTVKECFNKHPTKVAHLTNERLYDLWRERQEWRDKCRAAGRKSGRIRGKRKAKGSSTVVELKGNSSSSSSSSSSSKDTNVSLPPLPPVLDTPEFVQTFANWLSYKRERRESYKQSGMNAVIKAAEKRAVAHGVQAVVNAIDSAMANNWVGWDQANSFGERNGRQQQRHNSGRAGQAGERGI
jgi:uncharacterized protein YdaU (DUF1376 family)